MLAGMIASPSMYDPVQNPRDAKARRDLVLSRMYEQGMITRTQYEEAIRRRSPTRTRSTRPTSSPSSRTSRAG